MLFRSRKLFGLIVSLENLAMCLMQVGRVEESISASQQVIDLYRTLLEKSPKDPRDHSGYLTGRSVGQVMQTDCVDAESPSINLNNSFAVALRAHGDRLKDAHRPAEAIPVLREAASLFRECIANPSRDTQRQFVHALKSLRTSLMASDQVQAAVEVSHETVSLLRQLAAINPEVHRPDLAEIGRAHV